MFEDAEKKINKSWQTITYWKDGVMVGRRCTRCGKDKEIKEFDFSNKLKGTYQAKCKECRYEEGRKYAKKKEKIFVNEDGIEVRVNREGGVSYWKEGTMIAKKCTVCGEVKEIDGFCAIDKKKNLYKSECKKCSAHRSKQYVDTHKEKRKQYNKTWRENNKEHRKLYREQYYENNKEHLDECRKRWNENNKEYKREMNRRWNKNNKERCYASSKKCREKKKINSIAEATKMLYQLNPLLEELNLKAYGFIYKITNINTNRIYIGQTIQPSLKDRYKGDVIQSWIKDRLKKGVQKFKEELTNSQNFTAEIIDYGICKYHLDKLEAHYINKYNSVIEGYNNREGHYKSDDGLEEFQQILSTHNLEYKDGKIIKKPIQNR